MPAASLRGHTALITGAARRIGRETALTLAGEGVNIIVHYHQSAEAALELAGELARTGVQAWTVQADFTKPEEYELLIDRALETAGQLDLLINNASIFPRETLAEATFASLVANMEVNAWVPFVLSRAFAQRVGRGKIINLLDSRTTSYDWTHVGYLLSKHVLVEFTKMTALQYAPNITVNGVAPGLILPPPGRDESFLEKMKHTVPLKEYGDPQDIADAILYLAKSSFLTGEVVFVDGGRHLWEYVPGLHPE